MDGFQVPILLVFVFLYYCAGQHSLDLSFNRVSLAPRASTPASCVLSHPSHPQLTPVHFRNMARLGSHASHYFKRMTPVAGQTLWLSPQNSFVCERYCPETRNNMNTHNQAHIPRTHHGGRDQSFGEIDLLGYESGVNVTSFTAQRADWHDQGSLIGNGAVTPPTNYSRQPGSSTDFVRPRRHSKSRVTQEL